MIRFALIPLFLAVLPSLAGAGSLSEVYCDDSLRLEESLSATHRAQKHGTGMRGPDALFEIWIEPSSGDWTLVQRYAGGTSCILAIGEHWQETAADRDPA